MKRGGAKAPTVELLGQEKGSDEAARLLERRAIFGLPTHFLPLYHPEMEPGGVEQCTGAGKQRQTSSSSVPVHMVGWVHNWWQQLKNP